MPTGGDVISGVLDTAFTSRPNAEALLRSMGVDLNMLSTNNPVDDGIPPNGITGLTAVPFAGGVALRWDVPSPYDIVTKVKVEITSAEEGTDEREYSTISEATVYELTGGIEYTFRVIAIDEWGRESAWSASVTATPDLTPEQGIDLEYLQAQGTLQGLIEAVNLAGPTAAQGIVGNALAATQAQNMLPVIESDMEMWAGVTAWPPPEAKLADTRTNPSLPPDPVTNPLIPGQRLIDSDEPTGHTLDLVRNNGEMKIRHVRAITVNNYVIPVTQWRTERQVNPGIPYFAQATVTGDAGTVVSISVQQADDLNGANMNTASEQQYTLGGGTQKIAVRIIPSKPFVRIRLGLHTDNKTVYWYRFMLEQARNNAAEPSPWNAGIIAVGSISSRALTAMSANIASAVFEEAAIRSAHISELSANKITTGTLQVGQDITVLGKVIAGGMVMDNLGGYLVQQAISPDGAQAFPSSNARDWFSSPPSGSEPTPHSGIGFFDDSNATGRIDDPKRGILIHSRGVSGGSNRDGYISIAATSGGTERTAETSAFIFVKAAKSGFSGEVAVGNRLDVRGALNVTGNVSLPNDSITEDMIKSISTRSIKGKLSVKWENVTGKPNLVTDKEIEGFRTAEQVRSIVRDMVKESALK